MHLAIVTIFALAAVPEETFEQELAQQERPTTSGIIRAAEPPKTNAKSFKVSPSTTQAGTILLFGV